MSTNPGIAAMIAHDLQRAGEHLDRARTALIKELQDGSRLDARSSAALITAQAKHALWKSIAADMEHRVTQSYVREIAARLAIHAGRKRALDAMINGPRHSADLTARSFSEIEVAALRDVYIDLDAYKV
ncbi:hypothetical protein ACIRPQ_28985 [Streptomyces sp. NPDC101213]|uniref:hypothetical protein n=1 Tax=Streptomyces sp. NPDC101213 TaxID=3366130 RepID=UPI0037FCA987